MQNIHSSDESSRDYTSIESQKAFLQLPKEDQEVLFEAHHTQANVINAQAKVMKGPKTIEIAGYTILAMPLESMAFTPEQQKKFKEEGGLMNPTSKVATAVNNQDKMMYWAESFETLQAEIDGTLHKGFDLFKKVYEAFPDIAGMTKEEATTQGLYPIIHYRNHAARKWMAEMNGGHLATLDKDFNGELLDIYKAAEGSTNLEKLASMGQAPLGRRNADDAEVYGLGRWAKLGSGSLYTIGCFRGLALRRDQVGLYSKSYWQRSAVSGVVVLDK